MNEARLRELLREAPVPVDAEAERRGLAVLERAFAERAAPRRNPLPRLALALALTALLAAALLSPAGAAVRGWIGAVFTAGAPNPAPSLTRIPGGGQLLVQSRRGPWIVHPDGSRRLLGDYREATWSPHGLFVAVVAGRTLTAVEPGGNPHWSISAPAPIADPRWSPSGYRIAYRAGRRLRVLAADGSADRTIARRVAPLPPAWSPLGLDQLAYVDAGGTLRIADTDANRTLASVPALPGAFDLEWAVWHATLLEASRRTLWLRSTAVRKPSGELRIGPARRIPVPRGARLRDVAFAPRGPRIAALLVRSGAAGPRSEVALLDPRSGRWRSLFATPGRLTGLSWSPDGSRLLISWRDADQWLFVPADGRGRVRAVAGIASDFSPGAGIASGPGTAPQFPAVAGWCCAATAGGGG